MNEDQMDINKKESCDREFPGISHIKCRRTKERKIGYIIEKVSEWRKLYNGDLMDSKGKQIRLSLEEAA